MSPQEIHVHLQMIVHLQSCTLNHDRLGDGESWISETSPMFQVFTFEFL